MLEYFKMILEKVSFHDELFEKELRKATNTLNAQDEILELKAWCNIRFSKEHQKVINKCFSRIAHQAA
ncbi:hypothetical protein R9C00_10805 [Flammeovirgaceae bacterium SG7u.111]|nr:hypothetical protein [Flammeovirgaceae bacterium SG7u.132]WPO37941.1 hypothetical protein R9C00_10805 [Flammeovirgaceae bacterium SG7u.111]